MKAQRRELRDQVERFGGVVAKRRVLSAAISALLAGAVAMGGLLPLTAAAAPNKPSLNSSTHTATLTGNQSYGILGTNASSSSPTPDFSTKDYYVVNINNLTSDISPTSPYSAGVKVEYSASDKGTADDGHWAGDDGDDGNSAKDLTVNYDGGTHRLSSSTASYGIYLRSYAGDAEAGGDGGDALGATGGDGGDGKVGGNITLTSKGDIQVAKGSGIYVSSYGGDAGEGGDAEAYLGGAGAGHGGNGAAGGTVYIDSSSNIVAYGHGIYAYSSGGTGGDGGDGSGPGDVVAYAAGGYGNNGAAGGAVKVQSKGSIETTSTGDGIHASSSGGSGGDGGTGAGGGGIGAHGDDGGGAGTVEVISQGAISIQGSQGYGIYATSMAGSGGTGGYGNGIDGVGASGGNGGTASKVTVDSEAAITVHSGNGSGIYANSQGGSGASGGHGSGLAASDVGQGGFGGNGGEVSVTAHGDITVQGGGTNGINMRSSGGNGAAGGQGGATNGRGGSGGHGGNAGKITLVDSTGTITSPGSGVVAKSTGGAGGVGGAGAGVGAFGAQGGYGGAGGAINLTSHGAISVQEAGRQGIDASSLGGAGANGGDSTGGGGTGGNGGAGGIGGEVTVTNWGGITASASKSQGIAAESRGGAGGAGGTSKTGTKSHAGSGGTAGAGGKVTVNSHGEIQSSGTGLYAASTGGAGGVGGFGGGTDGQGGNGGVGGSGGEVVVTGTGAITASGQGHGIQAISRGTAGGAGGVGEGVDGIGHDGGGGGAGGAVTVTNQGSITVQGSGFHGIQALSEAGVGGKGGDATGAGGKAGAGGRGGTGGKVVVDNQAGISVSGDQAQGVMAASWGGAGGNGGTGDGMVGIGGSAKGSGPGGEVRVTSTGPIQTAGETSRGIFAQSVGGFGGSAGDAGGLLAYGASGESGGVGGSVTIINSGNVTTSGGSSEALFAQSVGGGGGSGGSTGGVINLGTSEGQAGGKGGVVSVTNSGRLQTTSNDAEGIFAQSIGGGGGDGGDEIAGSYGVSVAIGGSGGSGGAGDQVSVDSANVITTGGDNASGIHAQSAGGGGGSGGYAISAAVGISFPVSVAMGGSGGDGGDGGVVAVESDSTIETQGDNAYGIFAESLGGGGGSGGFAISASASEASSHAFSLGGSGGGGGNGMQVTVTSTGAITTTGVNADGILAQSVGGGGGAGGYSAVGILGTATSVGVALGGHGETGGAGGEVTLTNSGAIDTSGATSPGLLAQSVGGGGGSGSFSVAASMSVISATVGLGGSGAAGGDAGTVIVNNDAEISTAGELAYALLAQSVGGGGGFGGYSLSADVGIGALGFAMGGKGDSGGLGGMVTVDNSGALTTVAKGSHGILAQSVGGGGGAGGWAGTGAMSFGFGAGEITVPSASLSISVGGEGGSGNDASQVQVDNSGAILTQGEGADGLLAQSVGGRGGDAGWAAAAAVNLSAGKTYSANLSVAIGGNGGSGGVGGEVDVTNGAAIHTQGSNALGLLAQSIGGGGGSGGASAAVSIEAGTPSSTSFNSAVSVGGHAGSGGDAALVSVDSSAPVVTEGLGSTGILAQSLGGGGGTGGASISGVLGLSTKPYQLQTSVGGSGGGGGDAGGVDLTATGGVTTQGDQAVGVLAQSIGGGGGEGALSFNGQLSLNASKDLSVAVGGSGGVAGDGNGVSITTDGVISTLGEDSHGILAQSIGGGGGVGNFGGSGVLDIQAGEKYAVNLSVNVGGAGGAAGAGGTVDVDNQADISTGGEGAHAIFAQSVGGGGGEAGGGFTGHVNVEATEAYSWELGVSVGGTGGEGNQGGTVTVHNRGGIETLGYGAHGIFAQSVGGGGGEGGDGKDFALILAKPAVKPEHLPTSLAVSLGGTGGGSAVGGGVTITNESAIATEGAYAKGIFAQSVGGGGGVGGGNKGHLIRDEIIPGTVGITVGGDGGNSSHGGTVDITNSGLITTLGEGSHAIQAQSVGGGGGVGGEGEVGLLKPAIGIGGAAGAGGRGGQITVTNSGGIETTGDGARGIMAQSVGGGGGEAGSVARFMPEYADIGIGIGWAQDGGAGGDGGLVTVNNTANISTHGASAAAIWAQSVGGGGGEAGEVGYGPGAVINYFVGSVGDAGAGGTVTVNHGGNLTTEGADSSGIFAQSAGGEGRGGAVNIGVTGNVLAFGEGSNGIDAQSIGLGGNGNIQVNLNSGSVQGGAGGAGVVFRDGAANTLNNRGTITSLEGVEGTAIQTIFSEEGPGTPGNLNVQNYGTLIGSVMQATEAGEVAAGAASPVGVINITNNVGAVFDAGSTIHLGSGTLTNQGTLNLGDGGSTQTTLTGNFVQSGTGVLQTTLNDDGTGGGLRVSGSATLAGTLRGTLGTGAFQNGATYSVLTAGQDITTRFATLDLPNTSLVSFNTLYAPREVQVQSTVQSFTTVAANLHHEGLAGHMDAQLPVATEGFARFLGIFQTMDESNYDEGFESLSPGIYDATTLTTFDANRQYIDSVQQRLSLVRDNLRPERGVVMASRSGANTLVGQAAGNVSGSLYQRMGMSIQGFGNWGDYDPQDGYSGFDLSTGGVTVGLDYGVSERLAVGANFGYASTDIDQDNRFADGAFDSYFGSLYATYFTDQGYLEGILTYGRHSYDNTRLINVAGTQALAVSSHDGDSLSAFVEGGYTFQMQEWAVQPLASLHYATLDEEGVQETGAGALNMRVAGRDTSALVSEAGVRVSRAIPTSMGVLVPELKATWRHDFGIDDDALPISWAGAPTGLRIAGRQVGEDSAVLNLGVNLTSRSGITTSLKYGAVLGDGHTDQAVLGQIRMEF